MEYSPINDEHQKYLENGTKVRNDIYAALKQHVPESCFSEFMEAKQLSEKPVVQECPPTLLEQADRYMSKNTSLDVTPDVVKDFTSNATLTNDKINAIYESTKEQATCSQWFEQRKERMTASVLHRVFTRSKTLQHSPEKDHVPLVSTLMGYNKMVETAALKHGKSMKPHAKAKYLQLAKQKHRKLSSEEPGLLVHTQHPYIGASADVDINCACCGFGHVEIKCPYSVRHTSPTADNLPYL